ncbi:MAG TPA: glutamate--tRNA ligase [Gammaproteobacteria bacterium]|nr:glutamate--tRNA ligase [Gammaproteobacteria bacterium]
MSVRTRFAPSPTGYLHVGGARTALFSWLYARRHKGTFILRIEDTDLERSTPQAVQAILQSMDWLGLNYDEGPFYQTRHFERYHEVVKQLLTAGRAYRCYCSKEELEAMRAAQMARKEKPRYNGRCRERRDPPPVGIEPVIRFKNPLDGEVVVEDQIHGRVVFQNRELDDLIIARADGTPTYNFTVVVDDMDMRVTHVIRGDDHLNNTPRQINIMQALNATPPVYAHVPMILGPDGKKLSKRHGTVSVMQYEEEGFLPEALLNYLVRLGWSHGDGEVFSIAEMIEKFDIRDVNKSAAAFNPEKLLWLNQHHIKQAGADRLAKLLRDYLHRLGVDASRGPPLTEVIEPLRERSKTLVEMANASRIFYEDFKDYDPAAAKNLTMESKPALAALREQFAVLKDWSAVAIHGVVNAVAEQRGLKLGRVAQPLRVAVCGGTVSPPIDVTLKLLGRERTLNCLDRALAFIDGGRA